MAEQLREFLQFLQPNSRLDLKTLALQGLLSLTGSPEGIKQLSQVPELFGCVLRLTEDKCASVAKDAALALINSAADSSCAKLMLTEEECHVVKCLWSRIEYDGSGSSTQESSTQPDASEAVVDPCCMVMSNLTSHPDTYSLAWNAMKASPETMSLDRLVDLLLRVPRDASKGPFRHYLSSVLCNLSQLDEVRLKLLENSACLLQKVMALTDHANLIRRGGAIGTMRNCCYNWDHHDFLLKHTDILTKLLLPLAGPTDDDEDEEEVEKLPIDLQYLDSSKQVEEDADLREMLLQGLLQFCAVRQGREFFREKNVYLILKQLHKNERNKQVRLACENVVDVLIKTEKEIGVDNYHDVVVPEEVIPELIEMDKLYLQDDPDDLIESSKS